KLRAYALQESGRDTVDANVELGLPVDARSFLVAAQILEALGVQSVHLLSHNPVKTEALQLGGIDVTETISLATHPTPAHLRHLTTNSHRPGHHLLGLPGQPTGAQAAPETASGQHPVGSASSTTPQPGPHPLTIPTIGETACAATEAPSSRSPTDRTRGSRSGPAPGTSRAGTACPTAHC